MLHGHLGDDGRIWGGWEGGECKCPGVDYLCSFGIDYLDGLAGKEGGGDAVARGDGCWCHFERVGVYEIVGWIEN